MIKINLLGVAPPTPKILPGQPAPKVFQAVTFVGALLVSFAIVGVIYKIWSHQIGELEQSLKREKVRQSELTVVKAQNERYQQRLRDLETRINTIQALQDSRVGPVEMLSALGTVVNRMPDVFLVTLSPQAERIQLKGESESVESMANFLSFLKTSGNFQDIQLQQFYQDDQHNRLTYKFTLDFQLKTSAGAALAQPSSAAQMVKPAPPAPRPVGR